MSFADSGESNNDNNFFMLNPRKKHLSNLILSLTNRGIVIISSQFFYPQYSIISSFAVVEGICIAYDISNKMSHLHSWSIKFLNR